jgi:peptidoglycan/xylan/chitin deacetylase (PgdA/CDA1 family)
MRPVARVWVAAALACAACGESSGDSARAPAVRAPAPAPRVVLTAHERSVWAPQPPVRSVVPVLLYHGVAPVKGFAQRADAAQGIDPTQFARQMLLLKHAGYRTITLEQFARFIAGKPVRLPPRPLVLTFDGGRADSWTAGDAILHAIGFNATLFVDVGRVAAGDPEYLTWAELERLQRSGRWQIQLQSGTGNAQIHYGPRPGDIGPFYAYRGSEEVINAWRERVFGDIFLAERQLTARVDGYDPLAFAPPFGNYGQAGTNDPRIPRLLLARLFDSFPLVFVQDRSGLAVPQAGKPAPVGRIDITRTVTVDELRALLAGTKR